jgi:hypothetical protein
MMFWQIDDNLPLRKLCIGCLESIFQSYSAADVPHLIVGDTFVAVFPLLLADHDEMKSLFLQVIHCVLSHQYVFNRNWSFFLSFMCK